MRNAFHGTLFLFTLLLGSQAQANEKNAVSNTNWSLGIGSYAFVLANDNDSSADLNFSGLNIAAGYAINNNFQIRGTYFSLEYDENAAVKSKGFDLMAYGGTGLSTKGFRAYGGPGFYSDKWSGNGDRESFSGFQLGGGLGYNWGAVAVDFVINFRQVEQYEDLMFKTGTYFAAAGNLTVSYLF